MIPKQKLPIKKRESDEINQQFLLAKKTGALKIASYNLYIWPKQVG